MSIFRKKDEKLLISDGVSALATTIDAVGGGMPIASISQTLGKQYFSTRDGLLIRKIGGLIKELSTADGALLAQTVKNLREEVGDDYFNEAFFNSIEKSDSTKRAKMIGKLLVLSTTNEDARVSFWEILDVLQTLFMQDLVNVGSLKEINQQAYLFSTGKGDVPFRENLKISNASERRYRAAGIFVDEMESPQEEVYKLWELVSLCVKE